MRTLKLKVVIPEDHELVVRLPEDVPAGPAELIVLTGTSVEKPSPGRSVEEASRRFEELAARLAADPRPFRDLSPEERRERLQQVMGSGRGLSSGSEEFARRKQEEIDLEEERFGRR
jgi:hypothetical protein